MGTKQTHKQQGFHVIELVIILAILGVIGVIGWRVLHKTDQKTGAGMVTENGVSYDKEASQGLTHGLCSGVGSVKIGAPMKLDQVGYIQPYGLMVGGHVTPVDHQYYTGPDPQALRDTYDVIAPADGRIVEIQHRGSRTNTPPHTVNQPSSDEYRIVFAHTCSFLTYVDLVTSLDDSIKAKLPSGWDPNNSHDIDIPVKKGQVIGHIGGQTLDFAVWDLSKPLTGFINRAAYDNAESWKVFTAPTTDYLDPAIKDQVIAKYLRTVEPIDGKIDYDVDGKLIGTWFLQGTNGYAGGDQPGGRSGYWNGHLSFAPDYVDPSVFTISIGNYVANPSNGDGARQFGVKGNAPDPATVDMNSGVVKYELVQMHYTDAAGNSWNFMSFTKGPKRHDSTDVMGTVLVQLVEKGKLKVEVFPGKTGSQVNGFTSNAKTYDRGDGAHKLKSNTAT